MWVLHPYINRFINVDGFMSIDRLVSTVRLMAVVGSSTGYSRLARGVAGVRVTC